MSASKRDKRIKNGVRVREKISGFTGIVTGTAKYLNGCIQMLVRAKGADESKEGEVAWFDLEYLEYVDKGIKIKPSPTGSDLSAPVR